MSEPPPPKGKCYNCGKVQPLMSGDGRPLPPPVKVTLRCVGCGAMNTYQLRGAPP